MAEEVNTPSTHLDIVFVLDTTGSMSPYIEATKKTIISTIQSYLQKSKDAKFGIVAYRDFPPQDNSYITSIQNLQSGKNTLKFLEDLDASGGGDAPEAVLKALYDATNQIQWRNLKDSDEIKYKKVIIHAGDAPPHGKLFSDQSTWPNGEPGPDGKTVEEVAKEINGQNILYTFIKITEETNKMESIFKELFKQFSKLDNSLSPENSDKDKKDFEIYRERTGIYIEKENDYEKLPLHKKQKILYESKVSNYLMEL